jgi:hypothetical protein
MLGTLGKDFKYKLIDNFLSIDELKLLEKYCFFKHRSNQSNFDHEQNNNGDTYFYGDPLMESLMVKKLKLMQKETGLELLPTYAYWRMYTRFAELEKHKDRPSCEVSVTVQISSDGAEWPIYMDGKKHVLKNGQALIYLGMDLEHWREELQGDYQAQCFLHYVNANGKYSEFKFDKRLDVGM